MEADSLEMREYLYSLLDWQRTKAVLDVGCGNGGDLWRMEALAPESASLQLVGVNSSAKAIEAARAGTEGHSCFSWHQHDVSSGLPFAGGAFDAVFSLNLLECVPDKAALLVEMHRVLRPGGVVVCDGWMGRRLWPAFQRSGLSVGRIETYTLTNTTYAPGWCGYEQVQAFGALARRGLIAPEDYARFQADIAAQASQNEYFYSITLYVYVGQKI